MINYLHRRIHNPARGWDPVSEEYSREYFAKAWSRFDAQVLEQLETFTGGLAGREVLDLGGGPGQYSIALAERGANVTWFDASRNYRTLLEGEAAKRGVSLRYEIGHFEDATRLGLGRFDVVFNRVCWNYCRDDRSFSRLLCSLLKPGGTLYVHANVGVERDAGAGRRMLHLLNAAFGVKIRHLFPPPRRIAQLLGELPFEFIQCDYSRENEEIILARKRM